MPLALGSHVFFDANGNAIFDAGDSGIDGVSVNLYRDDGTIAGSFDPSDTLLSSTVTAGGGGYAFTELTPGDYIVQLVESNFNGAGPIANWFALPSSSDPDNNVDHDNNGIRIPGSGVVSQAITLANSTEPTNGPGNDTNNTLDFGFADGSIEPTLVGGNLTITAHGDHINGLTVKLVNGGNDLEITDANEAFIGTPGIGSLSNQKHTLTIPISAITGSITINTGNSNDTVTISSVDANEPFNSSLTVNGDAGDDTINLNSGITFAAGRNLNVDLTDDSATPGNDIINVGAGAIYALSGNGAATLKAGRNISMGAGSSIQVEDGNITLTANVDGTATGNVSGIQLSGASLTSSGAGNIVLTGQGGDDAATGTHRGISLINSATLASTGTGAITLTGTGGNGATAGQGVTLLGTSNISSAAGLITIHGTGATSNADGVNITGSIIATGSAAITITGIAAAGPSDGLLGVRLNGATLSAVDGDIYISGTAGDISANLTQGIRVDNASTVTTTGAGDISLTGTGGSAASPTNHGVRVQGTSKIQANGTGDITLTGAANLPSYGISIANLSGVEISTAAGAGNVTFIADSIDIGATLPVISAGSGQVTLKQKTAGTAIQLGVADSAGTLGITNAELNRITASTVQIGDTDSGWIDVSEVISPASYTTLALANAAAITASGGFASDVTSGTAYEKVTVAGSLTIDVAAQLTVTAVGGFVPSLTDSFTIIENTSASTTVGMFSGKPSGATVQVGGEDKTLTYAGGAGSNDLRLLGSAVDLTLSKENVDNDDDVAPGETITYALDYSNNGGSATGVFIRDTAPVGATIHADSLADGWFLESPGVYRLDISGSVEAGATGSATIKYTVDFPAASGLSSIDTSATIGDDGNNGVDATADNSAEDSDTLDAAPDLYLSLDNGVSYTQAGETLSYSIAYGNYGYQNATGVYLTAPLPAGTTFVEVENPGWTLVGSTLTYDIGALAGDSTDSATLILHVDDPLAIGIQSISSTLTIADDDTNGDDPYNDESGTLNTPVLAYTPVTISSDGKTARFTDVDGDAVTVKITIGKLEQSNFIVSNLGFAQLDLTDFGTDGLSFTGSRVSITAKRTVAGGDGLINLGYLNATGLDLTSVTINGDLGRINAGDADPATPALTSLSVYSMGMFDEVTQATLPSPSLDSTINGLVKSLKVRGDMRDISWTVTGGASADVDRISIGGNIVGSTFTLDGALRYLLVSGNIVESDFAVTESIGTITEGLRPGSYKLNGGISVKGSIQDSIITTDGILSQLRTGGSYINSVRSSGSLIHSYVSARGNLNPSTDLETQTVGLISVNGIVDHSQILIGYNQVGDAVNPDVKVGKLLVGTDWLGSDLAIGVEAGDDEEFATSDDTLIAGGNPAIAASLGSAVIRGYFLEEVDAPENSGISAETIGKVRAGNVQLTPAIGANGALGLGVAHYSSEQSDAPINPVISADGRYATFVDVDGDLVRVQSTIGAFTNANFVIVPMTGGVAGGGQLALLDLSNGTAFAGASITVSAKPGPLGGNGFVNVGYLNATGIDLLNVTVKGDLGRIDAGDANETTQGIGNVVTQSMGIFGTDTQPSLQEPTLESSILGSAGSWRIGGDILDVELSVSGKIGRFLLGGSMLYSRADFGGTIDQASIRGDMILSSFLAEGSIGKIVSLTKPGTGGWTVAGDVIGSELAVNGDISRLGVGGSLRYSNIRVRGDVVETTDTLEAQTIGSLTVKGGVELSFIEVGRDIDGDLVNSDVQVGRVLIGTDWIASSLSVGATPSGDQSYGTEDDSLLPNAGVSPIVARVASLVVKGHTNGGGYIPDARFGFIAEEFGSARIGNAGLPLTSGKDLFQLSPFSDVVLQEVSAGSLV